MIPDHVLRRWLDANRVALLGDVIRATAWAGVLSAWVIFGSVYLRLWVLGHAGTDPNDFTIFYYTARMVDDGLPMYGTSPARYGVEWPIGHLGNLNPPHVQMLLQPLAWLSYGQAFVTWTISSVAALFASVAVIVRTLGVPVTVRGVAVWGILTGASVAFTSVVVTAESSLLLLLPFTFAWSAARRSRWRSAGAWLGACIAIKLFFLLFVPWLVFGRRWRAVAAAGGVAAAWTLAGLTVHGVSTYRLWLESLASVAWWWMPMNASWPGFVSRLLIGSGSVEPLVQAPEMMSWLAPTGAVGVAGATIWTAYRLDASKLGIDGSVLVLTVGALLASPLGWVYYLPLTLGPLVGAWWSRSWSAVPKCWLVACAIAILGLYVPLEQASAGQPSALATVTWASTYFWTLVIAWCALVATAAKQSS
jgi:hypothetical protein